MTEDNLTPPAVTPEHIKQLTTATERGVPLESLKDDSSWQRLELEGGSGNIELARLEPGRLAFSVARSEDPSLGEGDVIVIDGASHTGGMVRQVLAPGARVAFRKKIALEYDPEKPSFPWMERFAKSNPDLVFTTDDGRLELRYFDVTPRATDFVAHAMTVGVDEQGKESSRYLF